MSFLKLETEKIGFKIGKSKNPCLLTEKSWKTHDFSFGFSLSLWNFLSLLELCEWCVKTWKNFPSLFSWKENFFVKFLLNLDSKKNRDEFLFQKILKEKFWKFRNPKIWTNPGENGKKTLQVQFFLAINETLNLFFQDFIQRLCIKNKT